VSELRTLWDECHSLDVFNSNRVSSVIVSRTIIDLRKRPWEEATDMPETMSTMEFKGQSSADGEKLPIRRPEIVYIPREDSSLEGVDDYCYMGQIKCKC
jgi:hypothetical protein